MIREASEQEARKLEKGCKPLFDYPDRTIIMVGPDLRELAAVHVFYQTWITHDGSRSKHIEIRVPAMGVTWIGETAGTGAWDAARREIHTWLESHIGFTCPFTASSFVTGGWRDSDEFRVGDRKIRTLCSLRPHPANIDVMISDAWSLHIPEESL